MNFELVLNGHMQDPMLMGILLNETIHAFQSDEELKQELITFMVRYYTQELKKLNYRADLSFDDKSFYIRKFRNIIGKLKKGELVSVT